MFSNGARLWLTEGGQSATGALLDHIIENSVASPHLANRAASQGKLLFTLRNLGYMSYCEKYGGRVFPHSFVSHPGISLFQLLNKILESMMHDLGSPFLAALTCDIHVLPDFHGNR